MERCHGLLRRDFARAITPGNARDTGTFAEGIFDIEHVEKYNKNPRDYSFANHLLKIEEMNGALGYFAMFYSILR